MCTNRLTPSRRGLRVLRPKHPISQKSTTQGCWQRELASSIIASSINRGSHSTVTPLLIGARFEHNECLSEPDFEDVVRRSEQLKNIMLQPLSCSGRECVHN